MQPDYFNICENKNVLISHFRLFFVINPKMTFRLLILLALNINTKILKNYFFQGRSKSSDRLVEYLFSNTKILTRSVFAWTNADSYFTISQKCPRFFIFKSVLKWPKNISLNQSQRCSCEHDMYDSYSMSQGFVNLQKFLIKS